MTSEERRRVFFSDEERDQVERRPFAWRRLIWPTLILLPLIVYMQTFGFEFVNLDDNLYVTENVHVQEGLRGSSVVWAFTTNHTGNWIPLTWLSLMLDAQLYGPRAGGFHFTNVMLHVANVLLLFVTLRRLTGESGKSFFVAALLAVHPLHVESVAWVTERKDVLSTFFGLWALYAYARYARSGSRGWYVWSLASLSASLLAKQMLVTFPLLLLLLDYWPLHRLTGVEPYWKRGVVREKAPFLACAAIFAAIAFLVQRSGGNVAEAGETPLYLRMENAILVYALYLGMALFPVRLAPFYPHPGEAISHPAVLAAGVLLVLMSTICLLQARRRPYLLTGWLWYLIALSPVIGIIQIGKQQMADRYTYVPLLGCYVAIVWLAGSLCRAAAWRRPVRIVAAAVLLALTIAGFRQASHWENSFTLYQRLADADSSTFLTHYNLGVMLFERGRLDAAAAQFERSLELVQDDSRPYHNLGVIAEQRGDVDKAMELYRQALQVNPQDFRAHTHLGVALRKRNRTDEAVQHFQESLRQDPSDAAVHTHLAEAYESLQECEQARRHYERAIRCAPLNPETHDNLGAFLLRRDEASAAVQHFREALRLAPDFSPAREHLMKALAP